MERRRFLRNLTIASTTTVLPFQFLDKILKTGSAAEVVVSNEALTTIAQPFEIDYTTKTIIYNGGWQDGGISLPDFYNFLKEKWDEEQGEFPMEKRGEYTYHIKELNLLRKECT